MSALTEQQQAALLRWRLILGKGAESLGDGAFRLDKLCPGDAPAREAEGQGLRDRNGKPLTAQMLVGIDDALAFIYEGGEKGASLAGSAPYVPRQLAEWLQNIRKFFPTDTVALIQKDAIEKKNLKSLLFEPETMPLLEKNIENSHAYLKNVVEKIDTLTLQIDVLRDSLKVVSAALQQRQQKMTMRLRTIYMSRRMPVIGLLLTVSIVSGIIIQLAGTL
jgi:hypothetical protein